MSSMSRDRREWSAVLDEFVVCCRCLRSVCAPTRCFRASCRPDACAGGGIHAIRRTVPGCGTSFVWSSGKCLHPVMWPAPWPVNCPGIVLHADTPARFRVRPNSRFEAAKAPVGALRLGAAGDIRRIERRRGQRTLPVFRLPERSLHRQSLALLFRIRNRPAQQRPHFF